MLHAGLSISGEQVGNVGKDPGLLPPLELDGTL